MCCCYIVRDQKNNFVLQFIHVLMKKLVGDFQIVKESRGRVYAEQGWHIQMKNLKSFADYMLG